MDGRTRQFASAVDDTKRYVVESSSVLAKRPWDETYSGRNVWKPK